MSKHVKAGLTTFGVLLVILGFVSLLAFYPMVVGALLLMGAFGVFTLGVYTMFLDYYG